MASETVELSFIYKGMEGATKNEKAACYNCR